MKVYPERNKWVCRITVRGVTEEFMARRRLEAMHKAVQWARSQVAEAA